MALVCAASSDAEVAIRARRILETYDGHPDPRSSPLAQAIDVLAHHKHRQLIPTLAGMLEFFDLRELQDTITSRALWPHFEPRFATKEALIIKFDQLAELRNGIRHSRTVDEITRKEGEASLLWFNKVLSK
jgi:hypothetical protein